MADKIISDEWVAGIAPTDPVEPRPLTPDEVAELDTFGPLSGRTLIPARAAELWEREIMWGAPRNDGARKGLLA